MDLRIFSRPQQGATYDTLLTVAKATETRLCDAFFRSDHYLRMGNVDGPARPTDAPRRRPRPRDQAHPPGTLMTAGTFRLPGVLAIQVAQVDQMSAAASTGPRRRLVRGSTRRTASRSRRRSSRSWSSSRSSPACGRRNGARPRLPRHGLRPHQARPRCPTRRRPVPVLIGGHGATRTPAGRPTRHFVPSPPSTTGRPGPGRRPRRASRGADALVYSNALVVCVGRERRGRPPRRRPRGADELKANGAPAEVVDKIGRYGGPAPSRITSRSSTCTTWTTWN
ncbi:LLM class F420-dependent oxidoreductase OS=Streptomyces fumanus OX=67302 GN=GCM10018772_38820 PE=4 SV=1 [Streptomyces fumanus]